MAFHQLRLVASSINPILLAVLVFYAWKKNPHPLDGAAFLLRSAGALLVAFVLSHLNRWGHLWPGHHYFPSGHMTFYLSTATSLFFLEKRSAFLTLPIAAGYGWLMVWLRFHTWLDVVGAALVALPVTLFFQKKRLRQTGRPARSAPPLE
jgi:membrane-associated phospholipid phosphatase